MKHQSLFPGQKSQKKIINLSSAEFAKGVLKIKMQGRIAVDKFSFFFITFIFFTEK